MAIGLPNYPNVDTSDLVNYPDGCIKDDITGINGTPINKITQNDIQMFFDKLFRQNGIAPNNSFDNEGDGYQTIQVLQMAINQYVAQALIALIPNYSAAIPYVLSGCTSVATSGYIFLRGEVFYVNGYTTGGTGTVYIVGVAYTTYKNVRAVTIIKGPSGGGLADYTTFNFTWFNSSWNAVTGLYLGTFTDDGTNPLKYKLQGKTVKVCGFTNNSSGTNASYNDQAVFTLPVGYRPSHNIITTGAPKSGAYHADAIAVIGISTAGVVSILGTYMQPSGGGYSNNGVAMDFQFDLDY